MSVAVDLNAPEARIAQHFMQHKGISVEPHEVDKLDDLPCWYFYYRMPEGELELEVFYDQVREDWDVQVTSFPVSLG